MMIFDIWMVINSSVIEKWTHTFHYWPSIDRYYPTSLKTEIVILFQNMLGSEGDKIDQMSI